MGTVAILAQVGSSSRAAHISAIQVIEMSSVRASNLLLASLVGSTWAAPVFVAKDQVHDTAPALDYVVIHPDCAAAIYTIENSSFTYNVHSDELTNVACNDPVGHDKAYVNVTGLPESCEAVKALIEKKVALYTPGTDASKTYDPHGTGKGYVKPTNPKANDQMLLVRLAGSGGKGMRFYQDTVVFDFSDAADGGCNVNAASQSEVSAGGDAGTNVCNIYNLISDLARTHGAEDFGRAGANFTSSCCTSDVPCFVPGNTGSVVV